ncbi:MAG: hypothetical protein ABI559_01685 [Chloroflexota bacterium]
MTRAVLLALTVLLFAFVVGCSGGDDPATATPTPDLGAGGSLPRHLSSVTPANLAPVTNTELKGSGICGGFSFSGGDGMGDNPTTLVKLFVQDEDVSADLKWEVTASQPSTGGTACYTPPADYTAGNVLVTLRWKEATGREFIYSWQINVTG